jgi:hypothetical protein
VFLAYYSASHRTHDARLGGHFGSRERALYLPRRPLLEAGLGTVQHTSTFWRWLVPSSSNMRAVCFGVPRWIRSVPTCCTMCGAWPWRCAKYMTAPNTATSFVPQLATSPPPQSPLFHVELDDTATAQQRIYSRIVGRHTAWTSSRSVGVGGFTAIMDSCFDHPHARSLQGLERQCDDLLSSDWLQIGGIYFYACCTSNLY